MMCLCWEKNERGEVIGIVSKEELKRRIDDPNFGKEIKQVKLEMVKKNKCGKL